LALKKGEPGKEKQAKRQVRSEEQKQSIKAKGNAKARVDAETKQLAAAKAVTGKMTTSSKAAAAKSTSKSKAAETKAGASNETEKLEKDHSAVARPKKNRKKAKNKKRSFVKRILHIVLILCCLFLIWCSYLVWLMNDHPARQDLAQADAGIVLGAALWRDQPSPALRERLQIAVELYNEGKVDYLVLSGGTGGLLSTISEAEGMRNFLIDKGIPKDKLLLENQSVNTFQNILFSHQLMQKHQLNSSIIITHDYHLPRAMEMANYLKYESPQGAAVHSKVLNPVYNQAREILALTKWKLEWLLLQVKILSPESIK